MANQVDKNMESYMELMYGSKRIIANVMVLDSL